MEKVSMKVGWMWFDSDPQRTFEEKVRLATQRYREKFGHAPTVCYVNDKQLNGRRKLKCGPVRIIGVHNILPHHFWLGTAGVPDVDKN